jgi:hypothetical protein
MALTRTTTISEIFQEAIENALKEEFDLIFEEKKKELVDRLDSRKDEILASLTLKLMKHIDMQSLHDKLIITLDTKKFED